MTAIAQYDPGDQEQPKARRRVRLLLSECGPNGITSDRMTWQKMPGCGESLKRMNFFLYRRMSRAQRQEFWRMAKINGARTPKAKTC